MDRRRDRVGEIRVDKPAPVLRYPELPAEQGLRRGGAEEDEHSRLDDRDFGLEPWPARGDLRPGWFLVNAALALGLPPEVFHRVRHVGRRAIDPGFLERLVQQPSGGAHEGLSRSVLVVTRLLADEHHPGRLRALSEDSLGAELPEVAAVAAGGGFAERRQSRLVREEVRGGRGRLSPGHVSSMTTRK